LAVATVATVAYAGLTLVLPAYQRSLDRYWQNRVPATTMRSVTETETTAEGMTQPRVEQARQIPGIAKEINA